MKRNRRIDRFHQKSFWIFSPGFKAPDFVIPPRSVVSRKRPNEHNPNDRIGDTFRIGYYRWRDGLDCVWLVDDAAKYCGTSDQVWLRDNFEIVSLSDETDLYGRNRPVLEALV
jgi:hypothetical protein